MAYPKENSTVAKSWFEETLKLKKGAELFIPCDDKSKQSSLKTRLYGARKEYSMIDPITAESISFSPVYRNNKPYIRCYKSTIEADKGFVKDAEGNITEVTINTDKDRTKKILLMIKDGNNLEKVEKVFGKLSEHEQMLFVGAAMSRAEEAKNEKVLDNPDSHDPA